MTAAKEYAKALFMLTEELSVSESTLSDFKVLMTVFSENSDYIKLADTPAVSVEEKLSLVEKALSCVCEPLKNLIMILCEHHNTYLAEAIFKEYRSLYNEARGICEARIITAEPLSDSQLQKIKAKLEKITSKTIILKTETDPSILGGIKLQYEGVQLDGSLKTRLLSIEKSLRDKVI